MKTAYEWFEEFEKGCSGIRIGISDLELNIMLATVESDVMELALDKKGLASIWLSTEGMNDVIKEVNRKWNEISDLFFEYSNIDIPKDMIKKHLEGSDEKRCKRLIGNLKRRNEKGGI